VTDGIESALAQARAVVAEDQDILIGEHLFSGAERLVGESRTRRGTP
jgi:hypothetical protein